VILGFTPFGLKLVGYAFLEWKWGLCFVIVERGGSFRSVGAAYQIGGLTYRWAQSIKFASDLVSASLIA
jgi:hypothetical protein